MNGFSINTENISECPDWLATLVVNKPKKAKKVPAKASTTTIRQSANDESQSSGATRAVVSEGSRNDALFRDACRLRSMDVPEETALRTLIELNDGKCVPPLDSNEVAAIFKSAYSYPNTPIEHEATTDMGNGQRMARLFGETLRYIPQLDKYILWNDNRWEVDDALQIQIRAEEMVYSIETEAIQAGEAGNAEIAKELWGHFNKSQANARINAAIERFKPKVVTPKYELDTDDYLLGVKNGVVDLKTGKVREAQKEDFITKLARVEHNPVADCPIWKDFLLDVMQGDQVMVDYLQTVFGYMLTGSTREQCWFFLHGSGANGKSTLINVIDALMGDYADTISSENLMIKKYGGGGASPELAKLDGKRLVVANELEENALMSEVLVKKVTGEDKIDTRFLYKDPFSYFPKFKFFMVGNHRPNIRGTDQGMWRRVRLIEFGAYFEPEDRDKLLDVKLLRELPGILNWMIEGCLKWQQEGLQTPQKVEEQTDAYRKQQDVVQQWLDECCEVEKVTDKDFEYVQELFDSYKAWAERNNEWPMKKRQFTEKLKEKNFEFGNRSRGRIFKKIKLGRVFISDDDEIEESTVKRDHLLEGLQCD